MAAQRSILELMAASASASKSPEPTGIMQGRMIFASFSDMGCKFCLCCSFESSTKQRSSKMTHAASSNLC
jgi:hypothetical protein